MDSKQLKGDMCLGTLCAAFFFLCAGFLIVNPAVADDITVCPSGCDYTSIQAAINACSEGDTIYVGTRGRTIPETYNENIGIIKGVNVVSEGADTTATYTDDGYSTTVLERATLTIIHGSGSDSVVRIPGTTTSDVVLDGFTIENSSANDVFLIRVGSGSPIIKNNIIRNNTGAGHAGGISLQGGVGMEPGPAIENNLIHNVNGPGIANGPNSHAYIHHNEIRACIGDNGAGIGLYGYAYPTIENNIIFDNHRAGIGSVHNPDTGVAGLAAGGGTLTIPAIKGNTISNNYAGIRLERIPGDTGTIDVTIGDGSAGNDISGPWAAIRLDELTSATIENNNIHDHFLAGISLGRLMSATILDNEISHNQAGIEFDSGCLSATVENNRIHHHNRAGINNGHPTIGHPASGVDTLIVQRNNDIYSNGEAGICIEYAGSANTIQGNTIHDNGKAGVRVFEAASVTIQENTIYSNGRAGIGNVGGQSLVAVGNHIYDNGYGGIEIRAGAGTITGNIIEQNNHGGVAFKAPCAYEISNNAIYDNLRGGIHTGEQLTDGGGYTGAVGDAHLTIRKNRVYRNGQDGYGGGIDVRHAAGSICNNIVYKNHRAGIRFGDRIDEIINNTVVDNGGDDIGGGIIYDDLAGAVNDFPSGCAASDIPIKNNICALNEKAGITVKIYPDYACPVNRDHNLLSGNFGWDANPGCAGSPWESNPCKRQQLAGCSPNGNEIFADPLFVDKANDNYELQAGSAAIGAGDDGTDMGAYGGSDPMAW
jgi:parallel beta-helix repeat protein